MRMQLSLALLGIMIAYSGYSLAENQKLQPLDLTRPEVAESVAVGDTVHIPSFMTCIVPEPNDYRCIAVRGVDRIKLGVVMAPKLTGIPDGYLRENCTNFETSYRSPRCKFNIKFKVTSKHAELQRPMLVYNSDQIEIVDWTE